MTDRVQLWSCGGGRQSAGIAALIVLGKLPKPDHVAMVALRGEARTTWPYVNRWIRPALTTLGIPFTAISSEQYATKGFWGGREGRPQPLLLLPAYSDLTGQPSKLSEYCSGEWKREPMLRWAAEQDGWKTRGVDNWIGISYEERTRRRAARRQWFAPVYPLLDLRPTTVSACLGAVADVGWPPPPRSRCSFCPNQSDAEWLDLSADELAAARDLEDDIRQTDPHAYFHKSLIPLREVTFDRADDNGGLFGGCSAGTCY
jgi:hypothetical protein